MPLHVPTDAQGLTPAFLTELIGELWPGTTVTGVNIVRVRNLGDKDDTESGASGSSNRITFDVSYGPGSPTSLPTRLLAKMSPTDDTWIASVGALFKNEVDFYGRLRSELDVETPLAMGGRFDPKTGHFILVMDDISTRSPHFNSILDDASVALLQSLLEQLAKLHAQHWNSPRFKSDMSWVQNQVEGSIEELVDGLIRTFRQQDLVKEKFKREFVEELGTNEEETYACIKALKLHQASLPRTFLHGDLHFNNTYVLPDGTGGLYDWQFCCQGFVTHDLNYLIATALSVSARRENERQLLTFYLDRLHAYGVANPPDPETLWLEYRRASLYGFSIGWLACPVESYGRELTTLALLRMAAACQDHDSVNLVRQLL